MSAPRIPDGVATEHVADDVVDDDLKDLDPISYYGADFDVHGLVRRLASGDIVVPRFEADENEGGEPAGFQRQFVWNRTQMDRFVESLLLGFPIPGIFLVQQEDKTLLVLDGQQRLGTLQSYYEGTAPNGEEYRLGSVVDERWVGRGYSDLEAADRRMLDNTLIHATVVKFSFEEDGFESIYALFERLNTGGTNLYPHEIRVALFSGPLANHIRELNSNSDWREIYGGVQPRLKDQEQILRFWAFREFRDSYTRPLKGFLNSFLKQHRNLEGLDVPAFDKVFSETCRVLNQSMGRSAFRHTGPVNAALADAVFVGVAARLDLGPVTDLSGLAVARSSLLEDSSFLAAIGRATADEDRVRLRLERAIKEFATVR